MTAAIGTLALLAPDSPDTWPQGILDGADLREQRANAVPVGPWVAEYRNVRAGVADHRRTINTDEPVLVAEGATAKYLTVEEKIAVAEHIAAEANPAHALAAVRRWREVAERHVRVENGHGGYCRYCYMSCRSWPCPDLREVADEARAYSGGAA